MKKSIVWAALFISGLVIGHLIPQDTKPKLQSSPRGQLFTYQAGLTNGVTKIGNIWIEGDNVSSNTLGAVLYMIRSQTNVYPESIVIVNAVPVY